MMRDGEAPPLTDAEIVAYLDGELSPADSVSVGQRLATDPRLRARLDHLMSGGRAFREAFDPLLAAAPVERLERRLASVVSRPAPVAGGVATMAARHWRACAAAAVVLVGIGVGLDRLAVLPDAAVIASRPESPGHWRRTVADYLSLYTRDTLASLPDAGQGERARAILKDRLGIDLASTQTDLPDLRLKRADLYDYDGKALAFLAYLDPRAGPVALCILEEPGDDPPTTERLLGFNVVHWSQGRARFMLIGRAASDRLEALAAAVRTNLDAKHG